MNSNYFSPPLARQFSTKSSDNPKHKPTPSPSLLYSPHKSHFLANPKSDYEDRQSLLKKAYNEQLKQAYSTHQQELEFKKQTKRNSILTSISPQLSIKHESIPEYFTPQVSKKSEYWQEKKLNFNEAPWIQDYNLKAIEQENKKNLWLQSLNDQIYEKSEEKKRKMNEKALKDQEDEARVRRELQELELKYKKELVLETGSPTSPYHDDSIAEISKIVPTQPKKNIFQDLNNVYTPTPSKFNTLNEKSNKIEQISSRYKLNDLRAEVNEMIKDLKLEAQSSKFEKEEVLRELSQARSILNESNSINPLKNKGLYRTGQSILSRPNPFFYRPLNFY